MKIETMKCKKCYKKYSIMMTMVLFLNSIHICSTTVQKIQVSSTVFT